MEYKDTNLSRTVNGCTIEIVPDLFAESPEANGDENLFLMASHSEFSVRADELESKTEFEWEEMGKSFWIFTLEAYIHSNISLSLVESKKNFPDRAWDVSRLGVVCVAKTEWKTKKKAFEAAKALVSEWNDYLSGNVWGFIVKSPYGDTLDSCFGFYGNPEESDGLREAIRIAENFNPSLSPEASQDLAVELINEYMPTDEAKQLLKSFVVKK